MPLLRDLTPGTFFRFTNGRDGVMVKLALPCQYAHSLDGGAYDPGWIADSSVRNGGTDLVVTFPTYAAALANARLRVVRPSAPRILRGALWCLERGYPLPLASALLGLVDESTDLADAHDAFESFDVTDHAGCHVIDETFDEAVEEVTGRSVSTCEKCDDVLWTDDATEADGDIVCEDCLERHYTQCHGCDDYARDTYDTIYVDDLPWCWSCYRELDDCEHCGERFYNSDHDHDHEESCDCEAPHRRFAFPANGAGTIREDERLTVELPAGTIDGIGMRAILLAIRQAMSADGAPAWVVGAVLEEVGPLWQAKRGNFPRRLSSALHKALKEVPYYRDGAETTGWKMPAALVSEVGNLARAHSSSEVSWRVEVTRDLNLDPAAFGNEESCWWSRNGDYHRSRCALKQWGGMGLRSYPFDETPSNRPSGRAWVQPVKLDDDGSLVPTHDALAAVGYVVYNGYGDLSGYTPARILAHLAGKTYRKIVVDIGTQYVNSNTGYLVADEATCAEVSGIAWPQWDEHFTYDADTIGHHHATEVAA